MISLLLAKWPNPYPNIAKQIEQNFEVVKQQFKDYYSSTYFKELEERITSFYKILEELTNYKFTFYIEEDKNKINLFIKFDNYLIKKLENKSYEIEQYDWNSFIKSSLWVANPTYETVKNFIKNLKSSQLKKFIVYHYYGDEAWQGCQLDFFNNKEQALKFHKKMEKVIKLEEEDSREQYESLNNYSKIKWLWMWDDEKKLLNCLNKIGCSKEYITEITKEINKGEDSEGMTFMEYLEEGDIKYIKKIFSSEFEILDAGCMD